SRIPHFSRLSWLLGTTKWAEVELRGGGGGDAASLPDTETAVIAAVSGERAERSQIARVLIIGTLRLRINNREITLANEPDFRQAASRVRRGALSPSLQIHWTLTTGHWPLFSRHSPLATPSSLEKALDQSGQGLGLVLEHVMPGLLEAMDLRAGKAPGPLVQKGPVEDEVAHSPGDQDGYRCKLLEAVLDPGNQVVRAITGPQRDVLDEPVDRDP